MRHSRNRYAQGAATIAGAPPAKKADVAPSATPATTSAMPPEEDASGAAHVATRAVEFTALLIVIGGLAFVAFVIRRMTDVSDATRDVTRVRAARLVAVAAAVLLASAVARLVLQGRMMSGMMQTRVSLGDIVSGTAWGQAWLAQVIAAAVVLVAMRFAPRAGNAAWTLAAIGALGLAATPALSGHAGAAPRWTMLAIGTDTLHVIGAAGWLGSLLFVLAAGVPALATASVESRWSAIASLVNAFSPVALTFAALVVSTGVVSATLRLGSLSALWSSSYGRVLLVKLACLSGVVGTGAFNWLRVRPTLGTEHASARLRRSASIELAIGILVLIVTAVLVATSTPGDVS